MISDLQVREPEKNKRADGSNATAAAAAAVDMTTQ